MASRCSPAASIALNTYRVMQAHNEMAELHLPLSTVKAMYSVIHAFKHHTPAAPFPTARPCRKLRLRRL